MPELWASDSRHRTVPKTLSRFQTQTTNFATMPPLILLQGHLVSISLVLMLIHYPFPAARIGPSDSYKLTGDPDHDDSAAPSSELYRCRSIAVGPA